MLGFLAVDREILRLVRLELGVHDAFLAGRPMRTVGVAGDVASPLLDGFVVLVLFKSNLADSIFTLANLRKPQR